MKYIILRFGWIGVLEEMAQNRETSRKEWLDILADLTLKT